MVLPKIVLWRRTARTDNPDTPQTHLTASDFHKYHSDTIRHPQYTSQTPPRHLRRTKAPADTNRHKQTPADANRHIQKAAGSVLGCPRLSVCVCWFLLASCVLWSCLGGIWGVYGGCLMVSEWYVWKSEALTCVWRVYGLSVLAVQSHNTILTKP